MNPKKTPSTKPKKHPDADQIAKDLRHEADELRHKLEQAARAELQSAVEERESRIQDAKKILAGGVVEAAQVIVDALRLPNSLDEDEARAIQLKTKNAQYNLKVHGLEADLAKQEGFNININITADHAARVERASTLTAGAS